MGRPRIRTIKPEIWQHEKIGRVTRDERLLFVGLLTMVDDEGRLREMPHAIRGHIFPYDRVSDRQLEKWLGGLERARLIVRYGAGRERFASIRGFKRHQVINRPRESDLPPPPGIPGPEAQTTLLDMPKLTDSSVEDLGRDQGSGIRDQEEENPPAPFQGEHDAAFIDRVRDDLRGRLGDVTLHMWLEPLEQVAYDGRTLTLTGPDRVVGYVRQRFVPNLAAAAERVAGHAVAVVVPETDEERQGRVEAEANSKRRFERAERRIAS